jgi:two-component system response regulator MprA
MGSSPASSPSGSIVVAEDDRSVRDALLRALRFEGHVVHGAKNGAEALDLVASVGPDCLILDVMMPGLDGLTACQRLRESGDKTPVLMLTARHEISDRVAGLDAGADDYLVKPFELDELFARVRALIRRNADDAVSEILRIADLELDPARRTVTRGGEDVSLTKTEFDLLELFVSNEGIVLSRDTIYERIWGFDFETSSKSLDVYVGYLRRKTELNGASRLIHTVRGVGYVARVA